MNRMIGLAACVALALVACSDGGETFDLTISSNESVALTPSSRYSVSLYGHDAFLADASATLIMHRVEQVTALPLAVAIVLPADPHLLIDQGNGQVSRDDARFYLAGIYVDVDGDAQICAGDLSQDFDDDGAVDFDLDGAIGPFSIPMKVWTDSCRPFAE